MTKNWKKDIFGVKTPKGIALRYSCDGDAVCIMDDKFDGINDVVTGRPVTDEHPLGVVITKEDAIYNAVLIRE